MFDGEWSLDNYDDKLRDSYNKLWVVHEKLGPFRGPMPTDSETVKGIFLNLRDFMRNYPKYFRNFVDQEIILKGVIHRHDRNSGKLKPMVDPLFLLSQRLNRGLKDAEIVYNALDENMLDSDSDSFDNIIMDDSEGLFQDAIEDPPSIPIDYIGRPLDSPPSKRSSDGEEGPDTLKRPRLTLTKESVRPPLPFSSQSFRSTPHTFSRTISAPQSRSVTPHTRLFKIIPTRSPFVRTDSTSTESTEYIETSSTSSLSRSSSRSSLTSAPALRSTTPATSLVSIPSATPSFRHAEVKLATVNANHAYGPIKITHGDYVPHLNTLNVTYYIQWELQRLIAQHPTVTWGDLSMSDFRGLKDRSLVDSVMIIENIIHNASAGGDQAETDNHQQRRPAKISDRKALLLSEVEKEEASIMAGDLRGVGNASLDWPYGGKIQYTISIEEAKPGEECVEFKPEPPTASQADNPYKRGTFARASSLPSGPLLKCDNPMGPNCSSTSPKRFPFKFVLRPPDMPGKSSRLARRYGSRRVISGKISKNIRKRQELKDMLTGRCFIILGRPYRALWATADQSVMFVEGPDQVEGVVMKGREYEPKMPTFQELLKQYNDLSQKPKQAMAKWAARPQILFSDSVPAAQVKSSAIEEIRDIITSEAQITGEASTEQTLTDGCGLMSESLAQRISHFHSLTLTNGRPSVIQMRIGGSKGLLAVMSPSQAAQYPGKEILLRDSMIKALPASGYKNDKSLLMVDVLRCESLKIGATITSEAMIAMVHNGVPAKTIVKLAENQLDLLRDAFLPQPIGDETEDDVFIRICSNCYGMGGVGMERRKRKVKEAGISARAAGLVKGHGKEEIEVDETDDPWIVSASERYGVDPISGQPGSIGEALMDAVGSGFHPATSPYTALKLHNMMEVLSKKLVRDFKIPVKQSLTAFIVPDSLQVLAPDEIFICFSGGGPIDEVTQRPIPYLEGDVLGYRSPCKVPTDVRRFKAVYKPELVHLTDCIVLSANSDLCKRSPASYLGGGDYDGDTVTLFWGKELVEPFRNAEDKYAETPKEFEEENFHKSITKGTEFLDSAEGLEEEEKVKMLQDWLLGGVMGDELTGMYSDLHQNATYTHGYDHPETIRLGRMFCHVLDARKSGLRVKNEVRLSDLETYSGKLAWRTWKRDKGEEDVYGRPDNERPCVRGKGLGPFIMDILMNKGEEYRIKMMGNFLQSPPTINNQDYNDFKYLWEKVNRIEHLRQTGELDKIEKHVKACYTIWQAINSSRSGDVLQAYEDILTSGTMKYEDRLTYSPVKNQRKIEKAESGLDILTKKRKLAHIWRTNPPLDDIPTLLEWYDEYYIRMLKISFSSFVSPRPRQLCPFDLDFRMACEMKAKASGKNVQTSLSTVYENLKPCIKPQSNSTPLIEEE